MGQRDQNLNHVWSVSTLAWVRMEQPTLEADSVTVELPNEGQQTMANSISVAIASDQSAVPVSGQRDDVGFVDLAENAYGALRMTSDRGVHVNLRRTDGVEIGIFDAPIIVTSDITSVTATTITAIDGNIIQGLNGNGVLLAHITGTWTGTLEFRASTGATDTFYVMRVANVATGETVTTTTANGTFAFISSGLYQIQIYATAWTSGTATVLMGKGFGTGSNNTSPTITSAGAARVDGSAVTQPVSIAATVAVTQSGTWTVQPGNTQNTTPWLVKEGRAVTATRTQVADSAVDVEILASNTNRLGATIYNDATALLYLALGTVAATSTNYTARVYSSGYYEVPANYTGAIRGIWASDLNDGAARVTELS